MRIQFTKEEINGQPLRPGTYNFIINDVHPMQTTDFKGNEATKLSLKLEAVPNDANTLPVPINYLIPITSDNETQQRIGRETLRNIVKAIYPTSWQIKLEDFDVEELINKQFNAEVSYYQDKYIQLKKIVTSTHLVEMPESSSVASGVPF